MEGGYKIDKAQESLIHQVEEFVKRTLGYAEGGHDWWHIYRVRNLARNIYKREQNGADLFIVELGALLHDIADQKFHDGDESVGPRKAEEFLNSLGVDSGVVIHVKQIIENISFKGGEQTSNFKSSEFDIVQDADRLDAMGAIGIARTFNYGGHKGRLLYHPDIKPKLNMSKEEYKKSTAPTINHFYEKLLLLKDRMNTKTGREMAEHRHKYMEGFLQEFYKEWDGEV